VTKSDWTLKYIQRQNPTRDDAERSSVCIEAAREDLKKKNRWQGNGPAKSKLKASQVPNEPKKMFPIHLAQIFPPQKKKNLAQIFRTARSQWNPNESN